MPTDDSTVKDPLAQGPAVAGAPAPASAPGAVPTAVPEPTMTPPTMPTATEEPVAPVTTPEVPLAGDVTGLPKPEETGGIGGTTGGTTTGM